MWSINGNKGEMFGVETSRHVHVQRTRQIYAGKCQTVNYNSYTNRKFDVSSCVPYVVRNHCNTPFHVDILNVLLIENLGS